MRRSCFRIALLAATANLLVVAAFADITTYVPYNPAAPSSNFATGPVGSTNGVAYTVSFGSNGTSFYGTLTPDFTSGGPIAGEFANLYFGTGQDYNQGATFGIEVENNRAFIPGVAGFQDLTGTGFTSSVNNATDAISFSLPFSYLMNPANLGDPNAVVSAANPFVMLRDSQSFGYTYTGGTTDFGDGVGERFGTVAFSAVTPEPSLWVLVSVFLISLFVVAHRRGLVVKNR